MMKILHALIARGVYVIMGVLIAILIGQSILPSYVFDKDNGFMYPDFRGANECVDYYKNEGKNILVGQVCHFEKSEYMYLYLPDSYYADYIIEVCINLIKRLNDRKEYRQRNDKGHL